MKILILLFCLFTNFAFAQTITPSGSGGGGGGSVTLGAGAVSAGAYVLGSVLDGAIVTLGTEADTASCATAHSALACLRQMDADIQSGSGATAATVPGSAIYNGINIGGNLTGMVGGHGTAAGALRVELPTDGTGLVTANPATPASWGLGATGATIPANAVFNGCDGVNVEQAAVTNGQLQSLACGLGGKLLVLPYTVKELAVRGTATTTGGSPVTLLAAGSGSNKTYATSAQCWNNSGVTITITFNDVEGTGSGTQLLLPAGGGSNPTFPVPLVTPAATALTFTPSAAETTIGCNAQGYYGL